ncbi:hypothetical protein CAEBREN_08111 [Caenorhabditis brenneri]|uniref:Uncharacterized protein n=1 Tax=Caenorhabditis brenneri TaxID=135651 RepID=G0MYT8_CAEBE|nr:hypothetical protein CAEBREN_08111 [Caenorhabditis brenneri]
MYKAQLTFISILNESYEKLPILRKGSTFFCVFCFNFHSSPNHECNSLAISNEAEKTAGNWLCQLVGDDEKVDRELVEKLKQYVITRIEEYEKHNNYNRIETSYASSDKYSFGKRTDESQSSADSHVEKSFDDGQLFSSTGRILRKTRYEAVAKSPMKTHKKLSNANIREDFEIIYEHVAPALPVNKRNWTRQHYIMHFHKVQHLNNRQSALFEDVNGKAK